MIGGCITRHKERLRMPGLFSLENSRQTGIEGTAAVRKPQTKPLTLCRGALQGTRLEGELQISTTAAPRNPRPQEHATTFHREEGKPAPRQLQNTRCPTGPADSPTRAWPATAPPAGAPGHKPPQGGTSPGGPRCAAHLGPAAIAARPQRRHRRGGARRTGLRSPGENGPPPARAAPHRPASQHLRIRPGSSNAAGQQGRRHGAGGRVLALRDGKSPARAHRRGAEGEALTCRRRAPAGDGSVAVKPIPPPATSAPEHAAAASASLTAPPPSGRKANKLRSYEDRHVSQLIAT
ncbi:proline-rich protein 2-like [Falco biarmicus]|uniref:proline-rich protein 2-like n=1 Tax=Falco biarmicus TaxID=345155 RepID=UPI0024BC8675|nr:proline-rich protein 2-like [Falco biarmicus]